MAKRMFFLLLLGGVVGHGQTDANRETVSAEGFEFLPPGLHFPPLKANHQEARVGVFKYFGSANLKVDVGNTIDVFGLRYPSSGSRFTAGIDFLAYAHVTGAQGLRLQVDALDGFFGGNLSFSKDHGTGVLRARLRILHLSAHFVDGHYDLSQRQWLDDREPIPFTRDFGEIVVVHEPELYPSSLRYYGGLSLATLVRPDGQQRVAFLVGAEYAMGELFGEAAGAPVLPFIADHFSLTGNPVYAGTNQFQVGVKFGEWNRKGVVLYIAYHSGSNPFSEYLGERVSIVGVGFTIDFP